MRPACLTTNFFTILISKVIGGNCTFMAYSASLTIRQVGKVRLRKITI